MQNDTNFCNFFAKFFENFCHILIFQLQGPGNIIYSLKIEHCMVSSNNGVVFNILISRNLAFFV